MTDGLDVFACRIMANLRSPEWWAAELPSFIIFTVLVGIVMWVTGAMRQRKHRQQFEHWRLEIIDGGDVSSQDLFWEEVERIRTSDFERWKMVKSVVSGVGRAKLTTVHKAEAGEAWVGVDESRRRVSIDLDRARARGHVV